MKLCIIYYYFTILIMRYTLFNNDFNEICANFIVEASYSYSIVLY